MKRETVTCVSSSVLKTLKTWHGAAEMVKKRLLFMKRQIGKKKTIWIYSVFFCNINHYS